MIDLPSPLIVVRRRHSSSSSSASTEMTDGHLWSGPRIVRELMGSERRLPGVTEPAWANQ